MNTIKPLLLQKKVLIKLAVAATALTLASIFLINVFAKNNKNKRINPAFASYISAYTSGTISRESTIRIQLAGNFGDSSKIGNDANVFNFSPSIKGKAYWIDASTIEFKPSAPLLSGQKYEAVFKLGNIIDVAKELEEFPFSFQVIMQSFEVKQPFFEAVDKQQLVYQRIAGTLLTADAALNEDVEKLLSATCDGVKQQIKWQHAADKRTHRYMIDSIERKNTARECKIEWDGAPLKINNKGDHTLIIPPLGEFMVMSVTIQNDGEQYISVYFSDPILPSQDLNGFITLDDYQKEASALSGNYATAAEFRFTINGNEIKCYPGARLVGSHTLYVHKGIKNILNKPLSEPTQQELNFADIFPSVALVGKGVVMPGSGSVLVPFEAVSLRAVDVTITKIFENNVAQFLQVNSLESNNELKRVGRPVLRKTIRLDQDKLADLRKPNRFSLQLDQLIKTEPGAIYNVKLSFKKEYSLYRCDNSNEEPERIDDDMRSTEEENWDSNDEARQSSYWDFAEEYYGENYNWNERDNPCHSSYYNPSRWVSKNVLSSDLGIVAKKGTGGEFFISVTDLISTKPLSGVGIELLDFQQQLIVSAQTDNNGWLNITPLRKPYLVVAKKGEQRGYLRVDDGNALTLSRFDVSGDVVQKGLKGFLYGERGVWRPGDSIYLTFILEDRNKTLPESHPVSFELFNPQGVLYKRLVQSKSLNGFYSFYTATDEDAPTGNWTAKVKVGGVDFQKSLKIETVMPNRLKINLDFGNAMLTAEKPIATTMECKWLHGAIADGLNANVQVNLSPAPTVFAKYSEYVFDDPTRKFYAEPKSIFDGKLDARGRAEIKAEIEVEDKSAGMLKANFVTKVFEPGGNFSIDRFSVPFSPYKSYIGMRLPKGDKERGMLLTDTNHVVLLTALTPTGTPVRGTKNVTVKLYKINWRWWWDKSEEDLSTYSSTEDFQELQSDETTLVNGVGKFILRVNYPDWGRYLLRVIDEEGGHSTGKIMYIDWPGWAGRAQRDNPQEATMLTFTADKAKYLVGEKSTITIPSSQGGRALVSIESGTRIIETHWVETQKSQTVFSFKVNEQMQPNVYVHVTLLQPHAQTINDLPIRLYGMIPIAVENKNTVLSPQFNMPAQLRPEEPFEINVSEATGKPMTYTLAIVDEGLLDLTRFKTPDPHPHFYAREALGVKTWDMFDYVMGAFGMQMNRILSIGGDEGINRKSQNAKANRFKPVVRFIGPFHLKSGSSANHKLVLPPYVGSVRVMVVAGYEGAYGFAEKAVPVKKPLMVLATLPRVVGPDETVKLPVTVFALEKNIKKVSVQIKVDEKLQLIGPASKTMVFSRIGDEVIDFDIKVKKALGIAKVKVIASAMGEKSEYDIEIDVRNPNPYVTKVIESIIDKDKSWNGSYVPIGMSGTNSAVLEVSSIPPINLGKRLDYLIQYPHGCVEQTTSSVFPQLALIDLIELPEKKQKEVERNIKLGIQRLRSFQTADGGLAYWPGMGNSDEWGSSYAGHFMVEAEQFGYSLPVGFLANWKKYQRNKALTWTSYTENSNDFIQAYRLYTLALAKAPELGAMNRLKELGNKLTAAAKWRLAAAYVLVGQKEVAAQLINKLPTDVKSYNELDMTYGSDTRDEAMILETLVLMGDKIRAFAVLDSVSKCLASEEWLSTQTTAYALIAISRLTGKFNDKKVLDFDYTVNGKKESNKSTARIAQIPIQIVGKASGSVQVKNNSGQFLYTRIILKGQPEIGEKANEESNLKMVVTYKDMQGNVLNPARIEQGTDFKMEVSITNPGAMGNYQQMALSQIFPSGWEIHNTRLDNTEGSNNYTIPTYQDIRDDRVYTYFNINAKQQVTFVVLLNASYLGRFYMPMVSCEAMYNAKISSRKGGMWVEVIPRGSKAQALAIK